MNKKPGIGVGVGIVVVAIVAVAMFAGCIEEITETPTAPSFDAELTQKLQTALDSAVNEFKVPGAVMVVRSPNGATWTGTSGLANLEDEAPMGSDMHLRIGSVTKTYTATVILQLVDEGLLRLDGTIEENNLVRIHAAYGLHRSLSSIATGPNLNRTRDLTITTPTISCLA
jgi:hypothetical protein